MKTWALFVDAYRELNSKKLFWITMLLSGLVVAIVGALGLNSDGVTFLWFTIMSNDVFTSDTMAPSHFYLTMFNNFGIRFWLSIIATVLALIATAGIIPDFISGGAVELLLSKPISRTRLYLTKFATGLVFVSLQVFVFSLAALLVIGFRGDVWEPRILLAVPIVALFYSYLFSICALIGLLTRSTLAALLLTILAWFLIFLINVADQNLLETKTNARRSADIAQTQLSQSESQLTQLRSRRDNLRNDDISTKSPKDVEASTPDSAGGFLGVLTKEFREGVRVEDLEDDEIEERIQRLQEELPTLAAVAEDREESFLGWNAWHERVLIAKTVLPKTRDTITLLERSLISDRAIEEAAGRTSRMFDDEEFGERELAVRRELRDRSLWWIVGTSLIFEAFVLAIGAWIFRRRDF